jgi:hypothetical protein
LPQACNQPATVALPKRRDECLSYGVAVRPQHDCVYRDVLATLILRTARGHSERLHDAISLWIEADRRVLTDDGRIERARGHEELEQRLLLSRRTAAE